MSTALPQKRNIIIQKSLGIVVVESLQILYFDCIDEV